MKKKVGFIGIGAMGKHMAGNLLKAGYEMYICDLNPEAIKELKAEGANIIDTPGEVAKVSEVVITSLPDSPEVEQVYLGKNGLLSGAHEGLILIDCSTIDPDLTRRIGLESLNLGVHMLDAPVGGSVANAIQGNLIMLVGGDKSVVDLCCDIFDTIGGQTIHAGPIGAGICLKLANNLMTGIYDCLVAEGLAFAKDIGVDREKLLVLLKGNLMRLFEMLSKRMLDKDFQPGFTTKLMHKDLRLGLKLGQDNNAFLPLGALSKEMFQLAINQGLGDLDFTSLSSVYEDKKKA